MFRKLCRVLDRILFGWILDLDSVECTEEYQIYEWYNERLNQVTYMPQWRYVGSSYWHNFNDSCSYTIEDARDRIRKRIENERKLVEIKPRVHMVDIDELVK